MRIREVRVGMGSTIQYKPYNSLRTDVSIVVELEDGEDVESARAVLHDQVEDLWLEATKRQLPIVVTVSPED